MDHTASAGEELLDPSVLENAKTSTGGGGGGREGTGGWATLRRARSEEDMALLKGEDQALYSGVGVDATSSPSLPMSSVAATAADVVSIGASSVGSDVEQGWMHWNTRDSGGRGRGDVAARGGAKEQIPNGGGGGAVRQRVRLNKSTAAFRSYDGRKGPRDVMRSKREQESLQTKLRLRADSDDDEDDDDDDDDYDAFDHGEDRLMIFRQRRTGAAPSGLSINETGASQFAADGGGVRSPMRRIMQAGGGGGSHYQQQQQLIATNSSSSSLKKTVAFREKAKRKRNPLREFGKHPSIPHNLDRIEKLAKNAPRMVHPLGSDLPSAMKSHYNHGLHPAPHSPLAPLDRILYNEEDGMRIAGYCIGAKLQLKKIISHFLLNPKASTNLFRDCFHMRLEDTGEVFFFDYGVIICWNMLQEHEQEMIKEITQFGVDPPRKVESDHFIWFMGDDQMKKPIKIIGDFIILKDPALKIRLAVSHALAQSTKLSVFEQEIEDLIENSQGYAVDLARYGKISMSREQLSMKMGELFLKKNAINLHTDLLDKPEFFWEHKKLEPTYDAVHNYLDVGQRREVLNKRLGIVQELFEVLKSEKDSRHGVRLELVVIWLIVAEAVLQILGIVSEWLLANKDIIL